MLTVNRRDTLRRWLKFSFVGALGILVQLGLLHFLASGLETNYLLATALAVEAAVLHNFIWHERFTWADRARLTGRRALGRLLRFNLTTGAISIGGNSVLMSFLIEQAELPLLLANLVSIGLCSVLNFVASDRIVFRSARGESGRCWSGG